MARPSNIIVSTVLRNQRFRGPTSSAQQNDFQAEVIRDVTALQEQWNERIVPLSQRLPDGTLDQTINAFRDGLDGRTVFANSDATVSTSNGQYYSNILARPTTVFEQFEDVYNSIDTAVENLENQITSVGGAGGLTSDQQAAIGINVFNPALQSSPTSIDGRSLQNQLNVLQVARDLYGTSFATFSADGSAILNNSVRAMVDTLLELHNGNWDDDLILSHTFSADDITGGTLSQEVVGDSASTGTGVSDSFAGSPTNLVEDLNQIRTLIRDLKDDSSGWSTALTLNANWVPVTAKPTDVKLLTDLKGSAARTDANPWGYNYDDVEGNETRLQAGADYAGQASLTDDTPSYSTAYGFTNGDDLTTAVGGLASTVQATDASNLSLATTISGHIDDLNNPHATDLGIVATAGGFAPAGQITIVDSGNYYTSIYTEGALQEIQVDLSTTSGLLNAQIDVVDSRITTVSGTLQGNIDSLETDLLSTITTVSGTLQGQIDSNDVDIAAAESDILSNATSIGTNDSRLSVIETSTGFRRYELGVSGLANNSSITVPHSGGMYPQLQALTLGNLTTAGYNANEVLPTYVPSGYAANDHGHPGVLFEHSGTNNVVFTNKLEETLASGIIIVKW